MYVIYVELVTDSYLKKLGIKILSLLLNAER